MGGFPSLGGGGYNNAVIVTEPKIDMTPEEEEEADRMLKTGDFSSIEAMLKTFGCTPEQIEHLMKTNRRFNPFYGGGPRAKEGNLPVQDRVTRTPKASVSGAIGANTGTILRFQRRTAQETNRRRRSVLGLWRPRTMFSADSCKFSHDEHFTQGFRKQSVSKRGRARRTAADAIWRQWWRRGWRRTVRVWWSKACEKTPEIDFRRHYSTRRLARRSSEFARRVRQSARRGNSRDRGAPPFRFGAEQQPSGPPLDHQQRGRRMPPVLLRDPNVLATIRENPEEADRRAETEVDRRRRSVPTKRR